MDLGVWDTVPGPVKEDNSILVKGLIPGKPYKFRVKAVNMIGDSDYAEIKTPIIAKNPYGELEIYEIPRSHYSGRNMKKRSSHKKS